MTILEQSYIFKMIIQNVRTSHSSFWCHFTEAKKWFINSFISKSPRQPFLSNPSSFVKAARFLSISTGLFFLPFTHRFYSTNFSIPTNRETFTVKWLYLDCFIDCYYIFFINICLDKSISCWKSVTSVKWKSMNQFRGTVLISFFYIFREGRWDG